MVLALGSLCPFVVGDVDCGGMFDGVLEGF